MTLKRQQRVKQTETLINLFIFFYFFIAIYKEIKKQTEKTEIEKKGTENNCISF